MSVTSSKNFGPIRDDYLFFEEHATEAAEDLRACMPHVHALATESGPIRVLDFGSGSGRFSSQFLALARFPQERLWLSLVEPEEALIGKPVPFHTAEDLEVTLAKQREVYRKQDIQYELVFPDSEENRLKILRFLLGSYFDEVPRHAMVDLFNPYAHADRIVIQTAHEQFVIRHQGKRPE